MTNDENPVITNLLSTLLGGLAGALVGNLLVRLGVRPILAGAGLAAVGGAAAAVLPGRLGHAAGGAAAAGIGQLALAWIEVEPEAATTVASPQAVPLNRNDDDAPLPDLEEAELDDGDVPRDADLDDHELAVFREELGDLKVLVTPRNASVPAAGGIASWLPGLLLAAVALLPMAIQRSLG